MASGTALSAVGGGVAGHAAAGAGGACRGRRHVGCCREASGGHSGHGRVAHLHAAGRAEGQRLDFLVSRGGP